jgi:hypothetical protein
MTSTHTTPSDFHTLLIVPAILSSQFVRKAGQGLIARKRVRKQPFDGIPRQAVPPLCLLQVVMIVPAQEFAVNAWPIQPEHACENRVPQSN